MEGGDASLRSLCSGALPRKLMSSLEIVKKEIQQVRRRKTYPLCPTQGLSYRIPLY